MADTPVAIQDSTAQAQATDEPKYVEVAQFQQLVNKLEGLTASVQGISRIVRKPVEKPADAEPTGEQKVTLASLKAQMDAERESARHEAWLGTLNVLASKAGIAEKQIELLELYVEKHHGKQITVEGGKVFITDELGDKKPFSETVKNILASEIGKTFLPPVETPGEIGNRRTQNASRLPQGKPLQDWTDEEINKNPEGYRDGLRQALLAQQAAGTTITQ